MDDYKLTKHLNVKKYCLDYDTHDKWNIEYYDNKKCDDSNPFLIIDSKPLNAFAHWVYENAIFLPLFSELKRVYPNLKIVVLEKKNYKKLFLDFFKIYENDIYYEDFPESNMCFFPEPICLNNKIINDNYKLYVDNLCDYFIPFRTEIKDINVVFLPRQKNENFKSNDRSYDLNDLLENVKNILNTDGITKLEDQIIPISKSKNIILTDGSPLLVNGLFAYNSNIIVCDTITIWQAREYPRLKYIIDKHLIHNKIVYATDFSYNNIKKFLM